MPMSFYGWNPTISKRRKGIQILWCKCYRLVIRVLKHSWFEYTLSCTYQIYIPTRAHLYYCNTVSCTSQGGCGETATHAESIRLHLHVRKFFKVACALASPSAVECAIINTYYRNAYNVHTFILRCDIRPTPIWWSSVSVG